MSLPVAVLAGGLAKRLGAVTQNAPKSLVDVNGQPFAVHQIDLLRSQGFTDIVFLVGHLGGMIRETLGDGSRWRVRLRYVFDGPRQLGTGGAILRALPELGERFLVIYGDSYLECDYPAIARAFVASGKSGLMTVYRNDDRWDRSNIEFTGGRIVSYDKQHRTAAMRHVDYGLEAFTRAAFSNRKEDDEFDLAVVCQDLLRDNDLAAFEVTNRFYEIGSPAGLEEARAHIAARKAPAP